MDLILALCPDGAAVAVFMLEICQVQDMSALPRQNAGGRREITMSDFNDAICLRTRDGQDSKLRRRLNNISMRQRPHTDPSHSLITLMPIFFRSARLSH